MSISAFTKRFTSSWIFYDVSSIVLIKNISYSSFLTELSIDSKMIINNFILKNNYFLQRRQNFDNLYLNIDKILKNEKDVNVFEYIYSPFYSGINYLNILFCLCKSNNDYNKLLNLVEHLLNLTNKIPIFNCDKYKGIFEFLSISELN